MTKTKQRILSAVTAASLLVGSAGVTSLIPLASAAGPEVTTNAATSVTSSGATLNATNGSANATGSAFWVSTSSASLAGLASSSSPTLGTGVYSTGDLGAQASSTSFSAPLSSLSIPTGFSAQAGTTYYYVAWVQIGGVWYPGSVLNFTTNPATTTSISNITVSNVGTSSATISWNTNVAGTGTVNYGTTSGYGTSANTSATASTTQSVTLTNLSPGTLYHFSVTANGSTSATSSDRTFITLSTASSTPLAVNSIDAIKTTAIANNTFEDGWKWVMHLTVPDTENAFRIRFSDWFMSSSTSFAAGGNIRISSPQSSNASTTGSALIPSGNNYTDWLYLTGDTNSSMPGRQIDLTIEVKIPFGTQPGAYTTTYTAQSWPSTATSTATQ